MLQLMGNQFQSSDHLQNTAWICLDESCQLRWNFEFSQRVEHQCHPEYCIDVNKTIQRITNDIDKLNCFLTKAKINYNKIEESKTKIQKDIDEIQKTRLKYESLLDYLSTSNIVNLRKHEKFLKKIQLESNLINKYDQAYDALNSKEIQYCRKQALYANYQCQSYKIPILQLTSEIVLCKKHNKQIEYLEFGNANSDVWGLCPDDSKVRPLSLSECRKLLEQYQRQELLFTSTILLCQLVRKFKENIDLTVENFIKQLENQILKNLPIYMENQQYVNKITPNNGKFEQKEYQSIVKLLEKNVIYKNNTFKLKERFRSEINEDNIDKTLMLFKNFNQQYEFLMKNHSFSGLLFDQLELNKIELNIELYLRNTLKISKINTEKQNTIQGLIKWVQTREKLSQQTQFQVKINEQILTSNFDQSIETLNIKKGSTIQIYQTN